METDRKLKEIRDFDRGERSRHTRKIGLDRVLGSSDTKQDTAHRQGDTFEALKHAVVELTNAVGTSTATDDIKSEPVQLGKG